MLGSIEGVSGEELRSLLGSGVGRVCVARARLRYRVGPGSEPESALLKAEIERIGRVCVRARRDLPGSNSKDRSRERRPGAVPAARGRVTRFDYYCQARPVPPSFSSFSFSFSSPPPLFSAAQSGETRRGLFASAGTHARASPVRAARATRVCAMHMYAAFFGPSAMRRRI